MKKLRFLKFAVAACSLATMMFVTSCTDDDLLEPGDASPSITFIGDAGYTSTDGTAKVGDTLTVGITAAANATSKAKLVAFNATITIDNVPTVVLDSTINTSNFTVSLQIPVTWTGAGRLVLKVTDKDAETAQKAVTITAEAQAQAGEINTYTEKLMGASQSSLGSFFAASTGTVYKSADAKTNSSLVDLAYVYKFLPPDYVVGTAILGAPTDSDISASLTSISGWTTKNATKFSTTSVTASAFDAITDDTEIDALTGISASQVKDLATGDVIAIETMAGKKGLIKIGTINTGANGDITITVKIQK